MSKLVMIPANSLKSAKKGLKKYLKGENPIEIPTEILEAEKDFYHVIIVDSVANKATLEFEHKATLVKYNDRAWNVSKDKLTQVGYANIEIIHNPTLNEEAKPVNDDNGGGLTAYHDLRDEAIDLGFTGAKNSKAEVFEAFIAEKKAEANAGAGSGDDNGGESQE